MRPNPPRPNFSPFVTAEFCSSSAVLSSKSGHVRRFARCSTEMHWNKPHYQVVWYSCCRHAGFGLICSQSWITEKDCVRHVSKCLYLLPNVLAKGLHHLRSIRLKLADLKIVAVCLASDESFLVHFRMSFEGKFHVATTLLFDSFLAARIISTMRIV